MSFPCIKCGACCRKVGLFSKEILDQLGLKADENGACVHLKNNECSIYEQRPHICRVDERSKEYPNISMEQYYRATAEMCNILLESEGKTERVVISPKP